jgi:hypothetical protein
MQASASTSEAQRFKIYRTTADQAFRLLALASQTTNRKLRDIAEELTQTRTLPVQPTTAGKASSH